MAKTDENLPPARINAAETPQSAEIGQGNPLLFQGLSDTTTRRLEAVLDRRLYGPEDFTNEVTSSEAQRGKTAEYADMTIPSPRGATKLLEDLRPDGYLSYVPPTDPRKAVERALPEITPETEKVVLGKMREWIKLRHGTDVPIEWMVPCSSTTGAMIFLAKKRKEECDAKKEDCSIASISPVFHGLNHVSRQSTGKNLVSIPMRDSKNGWTLDLAECERIFTEQKPKMFLFCNPHNPTGRVFSHEEVRGIVELCSRLGIRLVSDEVWCDHVLAEGAKHIPTLHVAAELGCEKNVMTVYGTGKTFNTSGIPCSVAIIPDPELREAFALDQEKSADVRTVSKPSERGGEAAIACLEEGEAFLPEQRKLLQSNTEKAAQALTAAGMPTHVPQGTYLLFSRLSGADDETYVKNKKRLNDAGIQTQDGFYYDAPGYVRVTAACPESVLEACYAKLGQS